MKPAAEVRAGIPADELLKQRGRGQAHILVWPSKVTGNDENGLIVEWEYADCIVELRRRMGAYRVVTVRDRTEG